MKILFNFYPKQATLMRRPKALILPHSSYSLFAAMCRNLVSYGALYLAEDPNYGSKLFLTLPSVPVI
jgi:hypothetical protein